MWCDKCFCLHMGCSGSPSGAVLGLVGGASPPRVADDSTPLPQGPLLGVDLGVSLDALSLEAAEALRRDATPAKNRVLSHRRGPTPARAGF